MNSKCKLLRLERLVCGELEGNELLEVRRHLDSCGDCASFVAELESGRASFLTAHPFSSFTHAHAPAMQIPWYLHVARKFRQPAMLPVFGALLLALTALPFVMINHEQRSDIMFKGAVPPDRDGKNYPAATRFAFVVGQNRGGGTVDNLRYAEDDAKKYARLLEDLVDVPAGNVHLLLHPDSAALERAARSLAVNMRRGGDPAGALLFFYYSGHADGEGLLLDSTRYSFVALRRMLDNISAAVRVAVFDACQSGVMVASKGGKHAEPFFFNDQNKIHGDIWIASAAANERAQESASLKSSLFSFHFFTGLHGSADVSVDGRVTVTEAYQYAYRKTLETSALTTGVFQHPVYRFNITGEGDIVMADLSKKQGGIAFDKTCAGTFLVLSRNYTEVFADFYKEDNYEKFVALPPGDYTIINAHDGSRIGLFRCSVSERKTVRCTAGQFQASLLPYSGSGQLSGSTPMQRQ